LSPKWLKAAPGSWFGKPAAYDPMASKQGESSSMILTLALLLQRAIKNRPIKNDFFL